ncbi:MAG: dephospho-CoA kinase [Gammaproteobacteria bacterium]|nr:dephospho-CoA kinase [Gammaproteobacteria bacterium]
MLKVGLTGGVGSGKSTVAVFFSELGVPVIDADEISRKLAQPGQEGYQSIVAEFGQSVLDKNGEINRDQLRKIVFTDEIKRMRLEAIIHPMVREGIAEKINHTNGPYCIIVIPLLIETGYLDFVDRVLVVDTTPETQISRVKKRSQLSEKEIRNIMAAQIGREERLKHADDIIENNDTVAQVRSRVNQLHSHYLKLAETPLPESQ